MQRPDSYATSAEGGATDHRCFDPLIDTLAARYETIAYDRRGRGLSGSNGDHALDGEARDLVEVVTATTGDRPFDLLGYSYGGLVSLHAMARHGLPARRAVLYEPPMGVPGMFPGTVFDDVKRLVATGDHDAAGRRFVTGTFLLSEATVEAMARTPMWEALLDAAPTMPAELDELMAVRPEDYGACRTLVRVLVQGAGGNDAFRTIAARLAAALPDAEVVTVDAVPHFAMAARPGEFLTATGL